MDAGDIIRLRLENQGINKRIFSNPYDVVSWLGAMQAQDYYASLWAVALRMKNAIENDIEQAISDKTIVRTWPMRGTLHFVAADDVYWMLQLLTPRVIAASRGRFKRLGIDQKILMRSSDVIINALQGQKKRIRSELYSLMEEAGIPTSNQRGMQILWRLALDGLICVGPRLGKQHTFVLLDEWISKSKRVERDEALAELSRRYFQSHGPATVNDFSWWSGLTIADAKRAIDIVTNDLTKQSIGNQDYWLVEKDFNKPDTSRTVHLLPKFDEYLVAYKDRSAALDPNKISDVYTTNGIFNPVILFKGTVIGTWKRVLGKDNVTIETSPFELLNKTKRQAIVREARRYGKFLDRPVELIDNNR